MKLLSALGLLFGFSATAQLVDGITLRQVSPAEVVGSIPAGSVIIVSEQHGLAPHHQNQVDFLEALNASRPGLSVAMEFLSFDQQDAVDAFLAGRMPEPEFLETVGWGNPPFEHYRRQAVFPRRTGGRTLAINSPRWLTGKIAKSGLDSLTAEERALLPADFTPGNALYKERFREVMDGHVSDEALERYFQAQSTWDESMADTACRFHLENPERDLIIIVGDFHAAYGGGLPDRLKARGCADTYVISQTTDLEEAKPHRRWGPRAEWVWVSPTSQPAKSRLPSVR